jgi:hypothetical protein
MDMGMDEIWILGMALEGFGYRSDMDFGNGFERTWVWMWIWIWIRISGMDLEDFFMLCLFWIAVCPSFAFLCMPVEGLGIKGDC